MTIRHSVLSGLCKVSGSEKLSTLAGHSSAEVRLLAVIALRRLEDSALGEFLQDENEQVKLEALRAVFDTSVVDNTIVGQKLLEIHYSGLPPFYSGSFACSCCQTGRCKWFCLCCEDGNRSSAGFQSWEIGPSCFAEVGYSYPQMDPFLGSLRPVTHDRSSVDQLVAKHGDSFLAYLKQEKRDDFATLATSQVSATLKIRLDADHLRAQL